MFNDFHLTSENHVKREMHAKREKQLAKT